MKKKVQCQKRILAENLEALEKNTSVILKNHASAPIRKERSNSTSKARREASRMKFVEKGGGGVADEVL